MPTMMARTMSPAIAVRVPREMSLSNRSLYFHVITCIWICVSPVWFNWMDGLMKIQYFSCDGSWSNIELLPNCTKKDSDKNYLVQFGKEENEDDSRENS